MVQKVIQISVSGSEDEKQEKELNININLHRNVVTKLSTINITNLKKIIYKKLWKYLSWRKKEIDIETVKLYSNIRKIHGFAHYEEFKPEWKRKLRKLRIKDEMEKEK